MKIMCHVAGCPQALEGYGTNAFVIVQKARALGAFWIAFMDSGNGLECRSLCPEHAVPVKKAVELLQSVFGNRFTHMHLQAVADALAEEQNHIS